MACGTPVLTSDASSLPELAGDAALLVDPHDVDSIRAGLQTLLTDDEVRGNLRVAGLARASRFDWTETARRTAAVLHEAGELG
jgi:glycosyltransferase involved in cell wall biosynthesis